MADEYNYEIDVYGDESMENNQNNASQGDEDVEIQTSYDDIVNSNNQNGGQSGPNSGNNKSSGNNNNNQVSNEKWQVLIPKSQPDNRPIDQNATNALTISDLDWWTTEEEVRGWACDAQCEYELKEVTFNEHKANGKSRGVVYMEFLSEQAATAVKHYIESLSKYAVLFANQNPFKMVPKDPAPRGNRSHDMTMGNNMNQGNMNRGGSMAGGMRGRGSYNMHNHRGGFQGRGGNNMGGGMPNMGFNPNMNMGFNGMPMGMFGFPGRGGMPMVGRGNGPMTGGRGRGGMDGNSGFNPMMGFGNNFPAAGFPQPHFNPAFFNGQDQNQQGGWQEGGNPHGNKRQRGSD
ncbi:hypothetical protein V1511DRAFT_507936 [Dipodascopsis uninucleata]